jgi:hypothetical protein
VDRPIALETRKRLGEIVRPPLIRDHDENGSVGVPCGKRCGDGADGQAHQRKTTAVSEPLTSSTAS